MRTRDEPPRIAGVALARVLRVGPRQVVRPRDEDAGTVPRETNERFRQREIFVHRHDVVHDDAVRPGEYRPKLAHEPFDERVVGLRAVALRERSKVAQHGLVPRIDLWDAGEPHTLRRGFRLRRVRGGRRAPRRRR